MIRQQDIPHPNEHDRAVASCRVFALDATDLPDAGNVPTSGAFNQRIRDETQAGQRDCKDNRSWYGSIGDDARAAITVMLREGWPKGAKKIKSLADELRGDITTPPASVQRKPQWHDEGDDFDLDRYLHGDLDVMYRTARRKRVGRGLQSVTLAVQWGGNAMVSAEQMFWQGATLAVLADLLDDAGYVTELHGFAASTQWGSGDVSESPLRGDTFTDVCFKRGGDMLDRDALAASLCHVASFRTFGFDLITAAATPIEGIGLGHAHPPQRWLDAVTASTAGMVPHVDLHVAQAYDRVSAALSVKGALRWLAGEEGGESAA